MNPNYFILIVFFFSACNSSPNHNLASFEFLRRGQIKDTILINTVHNNLNGNLINLKYLIYDDNIQFEHNYQFLLSPNFKHCYLDQNGNQIITTLMDSIQVNLNNRNLLIYKFQYDRISSIDEEHFLFYNEDLGPMFLYYYRWENHSRMTNSNLVNQNELKIIISKIEESIFQNCWPVDNR